MPKSPPRYPDAFRSEVVALVQSGERTIPRIARDLGIHEQTRRDWVKRAEIDAGRGARGEPTTDERAELVRLRREKRVLQQEKEILKKAAASVAPMAAHACMRRCVSRGCAAAANGSRG